MAYKDAKRRITLGILAHVDAGKTTLSEAILYRTGELRKIGRVDHGDAFLDDSEIERNRGITVFSRQALFTAVSGDVATEFTLIDTPGHVDFAAEMERALSVIDYALLVVSGSEGVQAHTRTLYRLLLDRGIPVFVFINKMDIAVRQKDDILTELADELGCGPVDFSGVLEGADAAGLEKFIDDITLHSPELADMVLEGELEGAPDDESIADAVRRCEIVPCIFGSALKLEGIEDLLEILSRFTIMPEYSDEFGARIYKTAAGDDGSRLVFAKITGGTLRARDTVTVHHRVQGREQEDSETKINQIRIYSGSRFTSVNEAEAGTVCALTGLSDVMPGDSLGAEMPAADPVIRPFMVYTVSGPAGMDPYLVMKDLEKLAQEDPSLSVRRIQETGETEIRLMGQVQLEVLTAMIKDRYGYDVTFGSGKVLYLETVTDAFEGVGHFEPLRHYAEVHLIVEPGEPGSGVVISSITPEDELARNWQRLILTHIDEKEHRGVLTGAPVTDVRITLAAGRAHDKHTSGGDFREATYRAVRNALMQARAAGAAALLEPWNEYEIELPSQAVGRAMTDIQQMGGTQESLEQDGDTSRIRGRVPASEIAGYQQTLISYTSGTGRLTCTPAGYAPCHDSDRVIEESGYDPERDIDNPADSVFVSHGGSDIVKWDEVPEHMHIGSVLRRYRNTGSTDSAYGAAGGLYTDDASDRGGYTGSMHGGRSDSEARKRQLAAEKELRMIFERTYGPAKERTGRSARENRFGPEYEMPEKTEEQKAADELRNQQIREKHEKKKTQSAPEERPVILIDGYNLIHADEYLTDLAKKDMGGARDQLLERLCNYTAYTGAETAVIFDAYNVTGGEGYEEDHLGVRVIYTSENEPADIRIGLMTNAMKNRRIYVVSSDMLVQQDSFEHGALRISSHEFMRLLAQTEEEIRSAL
ncbi:MAG: NYN domain-containing protein [Mogibacterium sp.]|nr:NYN domain-containing protein [Mogibacterium sp.]